MKDFQLRLLNIPAERLFKPRKRLSPISVPSEITGLLPFSETLANKIDDDSDFIGFIEYFSFELGLDNANDFKEYISENRFYLSFKDIFPENEIQIVCAIKYLFTSKRVLQGLVIDDNIFSFHLPYLAEASFDLECSLMLIEAGYFKQSLQALRNVIEVTLVHAYFSIKDQDYYDLLDQKDFRMPPLKEVVIFLKSEKLFTGDLERQVFELYRFLSGAVHSEILKLNTGRTSADLETFNEWYEVFKKVSVMHLNLIIRMIEIGI